MAQEGGIKKNTRRIMDLISIRKERRIVLEPPPGLQSEIGPQISRAQQKQRDRSGYGRPLRRRRAKASVHKSKTTRSAALLSDSASPPDSPAGFRTPAPLPATRRMPR